MRKLIITNSILAFLLIGVFILGYYFLMYPDDFTINRYIRDAEWTAFGLTFLGIFVGAIALSFLPIKNYNQKSKMAIFLVVLQGIFLVFLLFNVVVTYKQNKNYFNNLLSEYQQKADADIKSGFIEIEYAGGFELADEREPKMRIKIDSVRRTFGLSYKNSGCIVSAAITKAQEEYERLTKPYLDKRNGLGWKERMDQQIQTIRHKYR